MGEQHPYSHPNFNLWRSIDYGSSVSDTSDYYVQTVRPPNFRHLRDDNSEKLTHLLHSAESFSASMFLGNATGISALDLNPGLISTRRNPTRQSGGGSGSEEAGGTHLLLALDIWPLTTHPFRDGASSLLHRETPPTFGRSVRFFRIYCTKLLAYPVSFLFGRVWPPLGGEGGSCARARANLLASGAHSKYVLYPQNRRCPLAFPFVLSCTLQNLGTPAVGYSTKRGPEAAVFVTLAASLHLVLLYTQPTSPSRVSLNTVTSLNPATSPFVRPERALTRKTSTCAPPRNRPAYRC